MRTFYAFDVREVPEPVVLPPPGPVDFDPDDTGVPFDPSAGPPTPSEEAL